MWVYGFLKIVPAQASFSLFGATIGPNFLGGVLFPALLFGVLTLTPWIDRTNRRLMRRVEYLEPVRQTPARLASGLAALAFIGTLFIAAYYDTLGLSLGQVWAIVLAVPIVVGLFTWSVARRRVPAVRFDPHASPVPVAPVAAPPIEVAAPQRPAPPAMPPIPAAPLASPSGDGRSAAPAFPTVAARGERARDSLVAALHEFGELAPLVRQIDNDAELLEVLDYVDSLRLSLAESNQVLQGVVRGAAAEEPLVPDDG
jgi:hypothetical protein